MIPIRNHKESGTISHLDEGQSAGLVYSCDWSFPWMTGESFFLGQAIFGANLVVLSNPSSVMASAHLAQSLPS